MTHNEGDYWIYRTRLDRVVDGDTVDLTVDLGFRTYSQVRLRVDGVDTSEIYGVPKGSDEYERGMEQKSFTEAYLSDYRQEWPLHLISKEESGKYGRWIGDISAPREELTLREAILDRFPDAESE